jgi:hypothetical protein
MNPRLALLLLLGMAAPAFAGEPSEAAVAYVEGNVLATFYHEFGHALINQMDLPVLGREEDAADTLSLVLIEELWEEEPARNSAVAAARSFLLTSEQTNEEDIQYWDVHDLDIQRYYTHICLFYGANPEKRADLVKEFDLPEDRAEGCAEEYQLAAASWGIYLDELEKKAPGKAITFKVDPSDPISVLLGDEVAALNKAFALPSPLRVTLEECGELNAFYDPDKAEITVCTEYVDSFRDQAVQLGL